MTASATQPDEMKVCHEKGDEQGEKVSGSDEGIKEGAPAEPEHLGQGSADSGRQNRMPCAGQNSSPDICLPTIDIFEVPSLEETLKANAADYAAEDTAKAWFKTEEIIKNYSDDMVAKWNSEIDTLLVYAGLFSAILTAFNVQSYQLLQPPPPDPTLAVLERMSAQLGSFSVATAFVNSTVSPYTAGPSQSPGPTRAAVWLNVLWFSALICSLASASVGIMVKQWLREYSTGLSGSSHQIARLRQYRLNNLAKWQVAGIVSALPTLLQLSLALFLVGLLVLLWTLHQVVAIVATVLVSLLLVFTVATTILPAVKPDCCYLSPPTYLIHSIFIAVRRWMVGALHPPLLSVRRLCGWTRTGDLLQRWIDRLEHLSSILTPSTWRSQESYLVARSPSLGVDQIVLALSATLDSWYLDACGRACVAGSYYNIPFAMGVFDGIHGVNLTHDAAGMPSWLNRQTVEVWLLALLQTCWAIEQEWFDSDCDTRFMLGTPSLSKEALDERKSRILRYIDKSLRAKWIHKDGANSVRTSRMLIPLIPILLREEGHELREHVITVMVDVIRQSSVAPNKRNTWKCARYIAQAASQVLQCLADQRLTLDHRGHKYIGLLEYLVSCAKLHDTPPLVAVQLRSFTLQAIRVSVHLLHGDGLSKLMQRLTFAIDGGYIPDSLQRLQSIERICHQPGEDESTPPMITVEDNPLNAYWTGEPFFPDYDDLPRFIERCIPSILDPSLCPICSNSQAGPSLMLAEHDKSPQ